MCGRVVAGCSTPINSSNPVRPSATHLLLPQGPTYLYWRIWILTQTIIAIETLLSAVWVVL